MTTDDIGSTWVVSFFRSKDGAKSHFAQSLAPAETADWAADYWGDLDDFEVDLIAVIEKMRRELASANARIAALEEEMSNE
jgi:hypothetical protein